MTQVRSSRVPVQTVAGGDAGVDLVDGLERNKAAPYSFRIPSVQEKALIGPGDFVKLGFKLRAPKCLVTVERMWVEVTAVLGERVVGTLANQPQCLEGLRFGDLVRAKLKHVLQIHQPRARTLQ